MGNQLCLDFLNTRPVIDGAPVELLPDSASLRRWLAAAGLVTRAWPLRGVEALREFREDCRRVVIDLEAGRPPAPAFIRQLNALLAKHPFVDEIVRSRSTLTRKRRFDLRSPDDALGPLLDSTVDLLTIADRSRIRQCASCVLHFYDSSKKGTRRWCSMEMCGNRSKVAAYGRRQKESATAGTRGNRRSMSPNRPPSTNLRRRRR